MSDLNYMFKKYSLLIYFFALIVLGVLLYTNYLILEKLNAAPSDNKNLQNFKGNNKNDTRDSSLKEISDTISELEKRLSDLETLFQNKNTSNNYENMLAQLQRELNSAKVTIDSKVTECSQKIDELSRKLSSEEINIDDIPPELREKISNAIHSERKKQFTGSIKKQANQDLENLKSKLNLTEEQLKELERFIMGEILNEASELVTNLFEGKYANQNEIWQAFEPIAQKIDNKFKQVLNPEQYKIYEQEIKRGFYRSFGMIEEQSRQ